MIYIKKSPAPPELEQLNEEVANENIPDAYNKKLRNPLKEKVRNSLLHEQGHLCAYCMCRLPDERIQPNDKTYSQVYIEHIQTRSSAGNRELDYTNMLAVCSGNEKEANETSGKHTKRLLTCDKKRGHADLTVNPLDETTLKSIRYGTDGTIHAIDKTIDDDLTIKLNLNCSSEAMTLPQNRKAVLDMVQETIAEQDGDFVQNCIDQLHIWESEDDPKTPYIGIAIWWLKDQISANPRQ